MKKNRKISIVVFEDADAWLRENMQDFFSDNVCAVRPIGKFTPGKSILYEDIEEGTKKRCSWEAHIQALQKLTEQIGKTLFVGMLKSPHELTDFGNWDVEVVDAYWQLVYHGEVLYG